MPRFQLVIIGEGRNGLVAKMLHGLGFVLGAPGTGLTGAKPLPHVNAVGEKGGNMGPPAPFKVQLRFAPGIATVCVLMPVPLGAIGPMVLPFGRKSMEPVG